MLKCTECAKTFSRKDNLDRHVMSVHQAKTQLNLQAGSECGPLISPFTAMVTGPTGSGKSVFVKRLIAHAQSMISPHPQRIIWCYDVWQHLYEVMLVESKGLITFHQGIPSNIQDNDFFDPNVNNLIVFDDLFAEAAVDSRIRDLFTKVSHHRNVSVILITQNLFPREKEARTISLNCHYLVLFKNPRDTLQVRTLAQQMYPGEVKDFLRVFKQATSPPHGYLFIDLKQDTPDDCRLRVGIFPEENNDDEYQSETVKYIQEEKYKAQPFTKITDKIEADQRKLWKRDDLTLDENVDLNDELSLEKQSYWKRQKTKEGKYHNPMVAETVYMKTTPTQHSALPPPYRTVGSPQRPPTITSGVDRPMAGPKRKLFDKTPREPVHKRTRFKPYAVPLKRYNFRPKTKQTGKGTPLLQRYVSDSEYEESPLTYKGRSMPGSHRANPDSEYSTDSDVSDSIELANTGESEQTEMSNTESEDSELESGATSNESATERDNSESENCKYGNKSLDPFIYNNNLSENDPI